MNLVDQVKFVPLNVTDYADAIESASLNIENAHHVTLKITFGAITGNSKMSITSAAAVDTDTTTLTDWKGWRTGANVGSVGADTFHATVVEVDAGENYCTLTAANFATRMLIIELPVSSITDGHKWIRVKFSADATSGVNHVTAIVQPRMKQKDIPTMVKTT